MNRQLPHRLGMYAVAFHTMATLFLCIAGLNGFFTSTSPYDNFFLPYMCSAGPIVYGASYVVVSSMSGIFAPLWKVFNPSGLIIFVAPGLINVVLGGLQWYWIVRFLSSVFLRKEVGATSRL